MKKIISLIALILAVICIFTACKKEKPNSEDGNSGDYVEDELPLDEGELPFNEFKTIEDLKNFFAIEDINNIGTEYEKIFSMVREEGRIIKPLLNGEDVSLQDGYARIVVTPAKMEREHSHIVYYYTNGVYNTTIKIYYLDDVETTLANVGGQHALYNGDEETVERSIYGDYTIVTNLPDMSTYAERFIYEKYFVTVTGAPISSTTPQALIDTDVLDMLSFEFDKITE